MEERKGLIKLGGYDATIVGPDITVGMDAPEYTVHDNHWNPVKGIADTAGKVRIIAAVPSLDTGTCDREARRFNQEATDLSGDVVVHVISVDLPFAQKRWCGNSGVDRVMTLSAAFDGNFGYSYGVMIKERRLFRRATWVVDRDGKVVFSEYLPELGNEPDYAAVIAAAKAAL